MSQTNLTIHNKTEQSVLVYITLGAVSGCIQDVTQIPFIENGSGLQGWFTLDSNDRVSYTPPVGIGFNGNVSFGTPPLNCPTDEFESGVNLAEFILNNSFQSGQPQETIDISCVAGTNAFIEFAMSGGGSWNAGATQPNVASFKNNSIGKNKGEVGVFPYACTNCTFSSNPPACENQPLGAPNPITPQDDAICTVQRDASTAGGTVFISFNGYTPEPA